ncbi:MAG: cadherin-like domain-containing protein [Chloroflexi bacterium]|nr:cadherin-like domain-containing protein [Chloroflexota bacterium]
MAQTANQAPVANDDTYAVIQNIATVLAVLGNDTDPDGDTLTVQSASVPANGVASLSGGTLTYTPNASYTGNDSFTYTEGDGQGNYDTATVNLVVAASVGVPVANDDTATVPMNTATPVNVLANDTDPDGHTLTITAVSTPAHGTATIVGGTSVTYTPTSGYTGSDTFSYTVSDGFGSTDIATVTVTVSGTGNAPVVQNDAANVLMNTRTVLRLLANDSDPNGDALTITAVGTPVHGAVAITDDGQSITYAPPNGYLGVDSFAYTVSDGNGNSASGMVALVVVAQDALLARNDSASTRVDRAREIAVLRNDVPSDEDYELTVTAVTAPAHGTAVITDEGEKVTYTPAAGYVGTDTFVYTVMETGGATATATVTVTVRPAASDDDDEDFDKEDCKDGGWIDLGFPNQGLCIAAANHGHLHDGHRLFPNGLFPDGLFPNGLFPNGVFGDRDWRDDDDDDEEDRASLREERKSKARGAGLGAEIRESVRASIEDARDQRGNGNGIGNGKKRDR